MRGSLITRCCARGRTGRLVLDGRLVHGKTKDVKERRFAFPDKQEQEQQESVDQAIAWLRRNSTPTPGLIEARDGFFTTEPYTLPAPEPPQE